MAFRSLLVLSLLLSACTVEVEEPEELIGADEEAIVADETLVESEPEVVDVESPAERVAAPAELPSGLPTGMAEPGAPVVPQTKW